VDQSITQPDLEISVKGLPLRTQELLILLADLDRRTPGQQLLWIIECVANGRFKDLGEVPTTPRVTLARQGSQAVDSESVRVRAFRPAPPQRASQAGDVIGR